MFPGTTEASVLGQKPKRQKNRRGGKESSQDVESFLGLSKDDRGLSAELGTDGKFGEKDRRDVAGGETRPQRVWASVEAETSVRKRLE